MKYYDEGKLDRKYPQEIGQQARELMLSLENKDIQQRYRINLLEQYTELQEYYLARINEEIDLMSEEPDYPF